MFYREAHILIEEINQARELGEIRKYRSQLMSAELLILDDLFLRKLPANAGDELADVLMSRYERYSTVITSNRPIDDCPKLLGDVVVVAPLLDRLMHRGNLLKFEGRSWRLKEPPSELPSALRARNHLSVPLLPSGDFDRPGVGDFEVIARDLSGRSPGEIPFFLMSTQRSNPTTPAVPVIRSELSW